MPAAAHRKRTPTHKPTHRKWSTGKAKIVDLEEKREAKGVTSRTPNRLHRNRVVTERPVCDIFERSNYLSSVLPCLF